MTLIRIDLLNHCEGVGEPAFQMGQRPTDGENVHPPTFGEPSGLLLATPKEIAVGLMKDLFTACVPPDNREVFELRQSGRFDRLNIEFGETFPFGDKTCPFGI
jgi:hypothetical protein